MSFLRRVAGLSLRDKLRSSDIQEGLGVEPLLLRIVPQPESAGSNPFLHRGEPQHTGRESGGYQEAHSCPTPLTTSNSSIGDFLLHQGLLSCSSSDPSPRTTLPWETLPGTNHQRQFTPDNRAPRIIRALKLFHHDKVATQGEAPSHPLPTRCES